MLLKILGRHENDTFRIRHRLARKKNNIHVYYLIFIHDIILLLVDRVQFYWRPFYLPLAMYSIYYAEI